MVVNVGTLRDELVAMAARLKQLQREHDDHTAWLGIAANEIRDALKEMPRAVLSQPLAAAAPMVSQEEVAHVKPQRGERARAAGGVRGGPAVPSPAADGSKPSPRPCPKCGDLTHDGRFHNGKPREAKAAAAPPRPAPASDDEDPEPAEPGSDPTPALARARAKLAARASRMVAPQKDRAITISAPYLSREERRAATDDIDPSAYDRPRERADCLSGGVNGQRPCPFVSCSHHLFLDVNDASGSIKLNFPHLEVWEMAETCSLDVADRGGITLEEVGAILNLTRERIRQVEVCGLVKIKDHSGDELGLPPDREHSPLGRVMD